jgi:hypothetical protein
MPDSIFELLYLNEGQEFMLTAKALNWRKLPALQKQFHLTMDGSE